jgi:hypothetical protein
MPGLIRELVLHEALPLAMPGPLRLLSVQASFEPYTLVYAILPQAGVRKPNL